MGGIYIHVTWMDHSSQSFYYNRYLCRKSIEIPVGTTLENYVQAWGSGGVATFFTNSLLYAVVSCVLLILICAPAAYVLARYTFIGNKIIQTSLVSAMGIPITMIVLPLFGVVANLGILNNVAASKVT